MAIINYSDLVKWRGQAASNVTCGLTRGGRRIIGCGKKASSKDPHQGFWYKHKGLTSSVYLCSKCAKKV